MVIASLLLNSCIIQDPSPEDCEVKEIVVIDIFEGSSYDIIFKDRGNDQYYINRGMENGLDLEDLRNRVLNKKVTLHLPKFWIGTSEHIAQLKLNEDVLYTEFNK